MKEFIILTVTHPYEVVAKKFDYLFHVCGKGLFNIIMLIAILAAVGCTLYAIISYIRKKRKESIIWQELIILEQIVVGGSIEDKYLFYADSKARKLFTVYEVLFEEPMQKMPDIFPVKITKVTLDGKYLKIYVRYIERTYDFDVTWVGRAHESLPLGDDGMRYALKSSSLGEIQVGRISSEIPIKVRQGDKVRMKYEVLGRNLCLKFVEKTNKPYRG